MSSGTLSDFTPVSSTVYTATFTPSGEAAYEISISGTFSDASGNTQQEWIKVFRHNSANGAFFSSANDYAEAKSTNTSNPTADKFSRLAEVATLGNINGVYKFKYTNPTEGVEKIWEQHCNPVVGACTDANDIALNLISTTGPNPNLFEGLSISTDPGSTFLDGTVGGSWWHAIGAQGSHGVLLPTLVA